MLAGVSSPLIAPLPLPWYPSEREMMGCSRLLPTTTAAALLLPSTASPSLRLRGRPPRLRLAASASSSYNGWGELPDVSSFSDFPLLLLHKKKNLLLLLLLVIPASAVALSRLPPLPLLAAAFTAGFAARHLSSPEPSALTLILADLDAQVRALRDHLAASSSSHSQPLLDAVDRLRDAVLHATRLAHQDTTPTLAPLGDLAESLAAWARDTMRDLSTTKDLDSKVSPIRDAPGSAVPGEDMLPFHNDALEDATTQTRSNLELERLRLKHRRSGFTTESSLLEKRTTEIRDRSYRLNIGCEAQEQVDACFASIDPLYDDGAATDSDCEEFSRNVKEAAEILKKARECMMAGADEETADALLYKSAMLLSTAVALRPTSLVAVGQLGNTYLLHGELKLKISRELRTLLADAGAPLNGRERVSRYRKVDRIILSRDNISAALVDVCEECESLLVEAGRSYRTALSIDSGDVKALYNWGLALIFRAQLLADIGPEAAVDADRVYLAAIDKFDAMLSKSNTYAPEALYRWGTALHQRSHLRPRNNREKIRLLEQAKSLFEDVLYVEADNKIVREALSSCISELNCHGRWI